MNTFYVLEDDASGLYLMDGFKSLTNKESHAKQYETPEEAIKALIRSRIKVAVSVIKVTSVIQQESVKYFDHVSLLLTRNSHLDATHIGKKGNPYFYYCDEGEGIDYCFNLEKHIWEVCDWSIVEEGTKPRSQADDFIRINFEA